MTVQVCTVEYMVYIFTCIHVHTFLLVYMYTRVYWYIFVVIVHNACTHVYTGIFLLLLSTMLLGSAIKLMCT